MSAVRAHVALRFYGELPDEDLAADAVFDEWCVAITDLLNSATLGRGIVAESFSVEDADTEPDA